MLSIRKPWSGFHVIPSRDTAASFKTIVGRRVRRPLTKAKGSRSIKREPAVNYPLEPIRAPKEVAMQTRPNKVLYVEDNSGDARLFEEVFKKYGDHDFQMIHEESLSSALKRLSEDDADVVLLDLILPESSGMATLFRILLSNPHIPVVV